MKHYIQLTDSGKIIDSTGLRMKFNISFNAMGDVNERDFSASYPNTFPLTPSNQVALNNTLYVQLNTTTFKYNAQYVIDGAVIYNGVLVVNRYTTTQFGAAFVVNGFNLEFFKLQLKELNWPANLVLGTDFSELAASLISHNNSVWPNANCCWPMYRQKDAYADVNNAFGGIVNAVVDDVVHPNTLTDINEQDNVHAIAPWLYVKFVLQVIAEHTRTAISGTYLENELTDKDVLPSYTSHEGTVAHKGHLATAHVQALITQSANMQVVNSLHIPTVIPADDDSVLGEDLSSAYNNTSFVYTTQSIGWHEVSGSLSIRIDGVDTNSYDEIQIRVYLKYQNAWLDEFEYVFPSSEFDKYYTVGFVFDKYIDTPEVGETFEVFYYYRAFNTLDDSETFPNSIWGVTQVKFQNLQLARLNTYGLELEYAQHVPDVSVGEFFKGLKKVYNLDLLFDPIERSLQLNHNELKIANSVELQDEVKHYTPDYEVNVREEGYTLRFNYTSAEQDLPGYSKQNIALVTGSGKTSIVPECSPVLRVFTGYNGDLFKMPDLGGPINSSIYEVEADKLFRIAQYHGKHFNMAGQSYYLALAEPYNHAGDYIGGYDIRMSFGEYTVIGAFWRVWLATFTTVQEVTRRRYADLLYLLNASRKNIVLIDGVLYIRISSDVEVAEQGLGMAKETLIKVNTL